METLASAYLTSTRPLTPRTEPLENPGHFELRLVAGDNTIRWKNRKVFLSNLLARDYIGLEEVGEGLWSVYFGPVHLGWLDEKDYRIMDVRDERHRR
jgi:putative transposase